VNNLPKDLRVSRTAGGQTRDLLSRQSNALTIQESSQAPTELNGTANNARSRGASRVANANVVP